MTCYLIPDCKTCIKQEKLLKANPDPNIIVRYIPMSLAKKNPHTFPLWIIGDQMYEGIVEHNWNDNHKQGNIIRNSCFGHKLTQKNCTTSKEHNALKKVNMKLQNYIYGARLKVKPNPKAAASTVKPKSETKAEPKKVNSKSEAKAKPKVRRKPRIEVKKTKSGKMLSLKY